MRKLVLAVIVLLALFSLFRAYSQSNGESSAVTGLRLQPGLIEVGDGTASLGLSFGLMEKSGDQRRLVSVLPLRVVYRSGDRDVSVGLNGISFLVGGGSSVGLPVVVSSLHRGDLLSVGGRVTVDSRVEGGVWALGGDVELTPRAVVTGDVVAIGGKVTASPGAVVGGTVSQLAGMRIPFLGILGTQFSAQSLGLAVRCTGVRPPGLCAFPVLFLPCRAHAGSAAGNADALEAGARHPRHLSHRGSPGHTPSDCFHGGSLPSAPARPCHSPAFPGWVSRSLRQDGGVAPRGGRERGQ